MLYYLCHLGGKSVACVSSFFFSFFHYFSRFLFLDISRVLNTEFVIGHEHTVHNNIIM